LRLLNVPHVILVSGFLLDELRRVLKYPRVQRIHGLTDADINQYIQDFAASGEFIDVPPSLSRKVVYDPDDDPMVACAVYGRADALCTLDRHLRSCERLKSNDYVDRVSLKQRRCAWNWIGGLTN
jgi:predicted nucleic acid-binding protein